MIESIKGGGTVGSKICIGISDNEESLRVSLNRCKRAFSINYQITN